MNPVVVILLALLALAAVVLVRTLLLKETPAASATPPAADPARAADYANTLSEMIKIETISSRFDPDRAKFHAFQARLRGLFPHVYASCEEHNPGDGIVLRLPAAGTPKGEPILLMSHHDVVAAPPEGWAHAPFSGDIDAEGNVWGRGTVDTKGSLFCELQALEELLAAGWQPEVDVYITSTCTEEWGGPGAAAIVDWLKERGVRLGMLLDEGGMILQEPVGGVKGRYCMVGVLEKGYGDVKFIAKGMGGHASAPGKNTPLPRLGAFMAQLEKHNPFDVQLTPTVREMFGRMAPNMNFGMKLIFANLWLFGPLLKKLMPSISPAAAAMMQTTCAFTTAKGSDGLNVLPTEAYVTANLRFIHHQPNAESLKLLEELAHKYKLETEVIYQSNPCKPVDYTAAPFKLLETVAAQVYPGYGVVPYVMTGGTDARFYGDVCDHCLRFAPLEINKQQYGSIHADNENIASTALVPGVDFYKAVLRQYADIL